MTRPNRNSAMTRKADRAEAARPAGYGIRATC